MSKVAVSSSFRNRSRPKTSSAEASIGRRAAISSRNKDSLISHIAGSQVLDSRGNPTVEVSISIRGGETGRAIVPSGASTGIHEALELRDGNQAIYGGKSVLKAIANVNQIIGTRIVGEPCIDQKAIDRIMLELDGTSNKSKLGANAILGVSMAVSRAAALFNGVSLYRYLVERKQYRLPVPMMNVINGGMHAGNDLSVQEFLIEPVGVDTFAEGLRYGAEVYHSLKSVLIERYGHSAMAFRTLLPP